MAHADFVHLRVHTAYSLSEGAIRTAELAKVAAAAEMPAVAMTDSNNLFGAMEFGPAMAQVGVQPIIGCQLTLQYGFDKRTFAGRADLPARPLAAPVILLAQNETGYGNLMALVSAAFMESDPQFDTCLSEALLAGKTDGLICLTGGASGPLGRLLAGGEGRLARDWLEMMAAQFGDRLYVELGRHGDADESRVEGPMIDLAHALELPLVATNDCYFLDESMYEAHDALICIAESAYVADTERRRLTPDYRFKSAAEMKALFADIPEAVANTLVVAQRCGYAAPERQPILPRFETQEGRSEADELRLLAEKGLDDRLATLRAEGREADEEAYRARLHGELDIIIQMNFPGYFLIVADFIRWAKAQGIPVGPGRGSGAGSLVAYALTITDLDPLHYGLLFERFLNPERVSMPDFDIDFCPDRRDEVITYVQEKYGRDRVAQIITFGTLQARAALRDVGRVLQMSYVQVDRISKLVPNNPANPVTLGQAMDSEPRLADEYRHDDGVRRLVDLAMQLEGLYRHASTHAAGVVIADRPLLQLTPLYRDSKSDMPATQFSMKHVEAAGLMKFDFLGLKTLTVLDLAVGLVRGGPDPEFDLSKIPESDAAAFKMLGQGEAVGVFQLESSGMRDVLRQIQPDKFEDIIAIVALYRPGPMDNIPTYISAKHGREEVSYPHPLLKPILDATYGIPVYQEQVMQMAQVLSGYSLGEADVLRRAMGKKDKKEMAAQQSRFIKGAAENDVPADKARQIFELIGKFAGYGFNKSHAAAYALLAWHTAWMKTHYPAEFLAASMTMDMGNTDKLDTFRRETRRLGIPLLPPDVNRSEVTFSVERKADGSPAGIRYALAAIKNVGREAMAGFVAARRADGPFKDLFDLAVRNVEGALNKRQMENLVRAGALDGLDQNRKRVLAGLDILGQYARQQAEDRASGQIGLFGGGDGADGDRPPLPDAPPFDDLQRLAEERAAVGFYLSGHPLDDYRKLLAQKGVTPIEDLPLAFKQAKKNICIAGTISAVQPRRNAKGKAYAFVGLSDSGGDCECLCFAEALNRCREQLEPSRNVVVYVDILKDREEPTLAINAVRDLDDYIADAERDTGAGARIVISDAAALQPVRAVLDRAGSGRGPVRLVLRSAGAEREMEIDSGERFRIDKALRQSLKAMPGVVDIAEI